MLVRAFTVTIAYEYQLTTVNLEIFARVLFMRSFVKIKSSRKGEITLSFTDKGKSCHSHEFLSRKYFF